MRILKVYNDNNTITHTVVHKKRLPIFTVLQFLQTLTKLYNIWPTVYSVNLQQKSYLLTSLTYVLLLHYLGETSQLYKVGQKTGLLFEIM